MTETKATEQVTEYPPCVVCGEPTDVNQGCGNPDCMGRTRPSGGVRKSGKARNSGVYVVETVTKRKTAIRSLMWDKDTGECKGYNTSKYDYEADDMRERMRGDVVFTRYSDGSIGYSSPATRELKQLTTKREMPDNPKARMDKKQSITLERYNKDITKHVDVLTQSRCESQHGRPWNDVWACDATDGHRATLRRHNTFGNELKVSDKVVDYADISKHKSVVLDNPEFHLALLRAATMSDERSKSVKVTFSRGEVKLEASHSDYGAFEETLACECDFTEPVTFGVNYTYLEPALGTWPLRVFVKDESSPVVLEAAGDDAQWRIVIMPIRI